MAEFISKHRVVKLDNVQQNNIVLSDLSQNLSETVFEQQYKKTAEIVRKIIRQSCEQTEAPDASCRFCNSRNCGSCRFRDNSDYKGVNKRRYNRTRFQTAVPFIGERGTGKTSVLCSVLDYLREFKGNGKENAAFYLGPENDGTRFIAFDMIDANTLKCTEDVMEIILSRMLTYLEELQVGADFRDLYRQIDELHRDLGLIYWKKPEVRDGYGLTSLQRVADSQKVIDNFRKLVEQFTRDVSRYKFDNHPCFLVIALDDIDMYMGAHSGMRDGQFALLEQIYNHMRTPGLIVLMTYNEHILRRKCNEHFADIYFGAQKPKDWECNQSAREDVEALTAQFMSKVFPQERRVYLPNYLVVDSENRSNLYVQPTLVKDSTVEYIPPFTAEEDVPVKEFMLRLIAHRTGVYFDSAGSKQHFFEPRNLRELGELFQVLNSMEGIKDKEVSKDVKHRNRQELMNYLYNQYALRYLKTEEYRRFQKLSMLPLERQNKAMVDQIRQQRGIEVTMKGSADYFGRSKRDRWKYSYGELIYNMYFSTRIAKKETDETFYSKEFMHCILGTHSVLMNQLVQEADAREKLLKIIGSSIAGRWANEMLPKFLCKGSVPLAAGSLSLPVRYFINWKVPEVVQNAILDLHKDDSLETKTELCQYIEAMVIIGMFFTGFPHNGLKIVPTLKRDEDEDCVIYLRSTSEDHICFNILNFVINLYESLPDGTSPGYLSYMEKKINKLGVDLAEKFSAEREDTQTKSEADGGEEEKTNPISPTWYELLNVYQVDSEMFSENWSTFVGEVFKKIRSDIVAWKNKFEQFPAVLPIEHFDMMYNIIKRLANGSYYDIPEEAAVEEIFEYYVRFYERVAEELEKQDYVYFNDSEKSFSKAFRESFFYTMFSAKGSTRNPFIKEILIGMMCQALPEEANRIQRANMSSPLEAYG